MTLAHLHTSRATVPAQSNVIEGPQQQTGGDREWYYNVEQADKVQRKGPVSFQQVMYHFCLWGEIPYPIVLVFNFLEKLNNIQL